MFNKSLIRTGIALAALAGSFVTAQAASNGVMDCQPHDWLAFGEAMDPYDVDALRTLFAQPELFNCPEIYQTVQVLLCAEDPLSCVEPAAGDPGTPGDIPGDDPGDNPGDNPGDDTQPGDDPFDGQRPGEPIGQENDGGDQDSPGGDDGGSSGGSDGGRGTPGRP